jgi:hypothetical protein
MKASLSPASDDAWRRRRRRASIAVAALAMSLARPAAATPPTPAEFEAARSAFAAGLALEAKERWSEALDRFERASGVRASPQVVFHQGLCLEHLGRLVEALDAFVRVERAALGNASTRRVGVLAGAHVAGLRKRVPVIVLHAPRDAASFPLLLDGRVLPEAVIEMPFPVDPGEHRAVIEAPGRAPLEERIVASEGERVDVRRSRSRHHRPRSAASRPSCRRLLASSIARASLRSRRSATPLAAGSWPLPSRGASRSSRSGRRVSSTGCAHRPSRTSAPDVRAAPCVRTI